MATLITEILFEMKQRIDTINRNTHMTIPWTLDDKFSCDDIANLIKVIEKLIEQRNDGFLDWTSSDSQFQTAIQDKNIELQKIITLKGFRV